MARIRSVKPEFFRHEGLQALEVSHPELRPMLTFEGLWIVVDLSGRFEWRPKSLHLDILPFVPYEFSAALELLESAGFIVRYESGGKTFGHIPSFALHQTCESRKHEKNRFPGPGVKTPESSPPSTTPPSSPFPDWSRSDPELIHDQSGSITSPDPDLVRINPWPVGMEREREREKEITTTPNPQPSAWDTRGGVEGASAPTEAPMMTLVPFAASAPPGRLRRKRGVRPIAPFRQDVIDVIAYLQGPWPVERKGGGEVRNDGIAAQAGLEAILAKHPDVLLSGIQESAHNWIATKPDYPNAIQFYFGAGKDNSPAPWEREYRAWLTEKEVRRAHA